MTADTRDIELAAIHSPTPPQKLDFRHRGFEQSDHEETHSVAHADDVEEDEDGERCTSPDGKSTFCLLTMTLQHI